MNKWVIYRLIASYDEPPQVIPIMYVDDGDQAHEFYKNQVYKHLEAVGWHTSDEVSERSNKAYWDYWGTDKGESYDPNYDDWCEDWCKALDPIEEQDKFQEYNNWLGVSIQMMVVLNWRDLLYVAKNNL